MGGEEQIRERLLTMGAEIRVRRESMGLSIEEASDRTKIRAKYLRAVEAGDESQAPGTTYFKAFLKTYAAFLGLDGSKYSLAYQEILDLRSAPPSRERPRPQRPKVEAPKTVPMKPATEQPGAKLQSAKPAVQPTRARDLPIPPPAVVKADRPARRPRRSPRPALWAFALFFMVAVVVFFVVSREKTGRVTAPTAPPGGGPGTPSVPAGTTEPPAPRIVRTDPNKETTVYTIDRTPLELAVRTAKDPDSFCWVRVSLDGTVAFEKTLGPGSEEKVSAKSEIAIRAGKPWVISLTLNGKDLGAPGEFGPVKDITVRSVPSNP